MSLLLDARVHFLQEKLNFNLFFSGNLQEKHKNKTLLEEIIAALDKIY